jgi:hypothetical protein
MSLMELVEACEVHPPTAIVLSPEDFTHALAFAARTWLADWVLDDAVGRLTYRGVPIVRSREWRRSYILEDTPDGPQIHEFG